MKRFAPERFDEGRLLVNADFADVLRAAGMLTFDELYWNASGEMAKNLLPERSTERFEVVCRGEVRTFYIKRHTPPPWKEYVKPWLRLTRPILGARNEWDALLEFHRLGIPTMQPVALGESGGRSLLVTEAIEGYEKLSRWMEQNLPADRGARDGGDTSLFPLIDDIAEIARTMHTAGLHHQDFYLTHMLVPQGNIHGGVRVIDLGRVQRRRRLSTRWIVKDLAQLNYSAHRFTAEERERFLERYLGRRPGRADRSLIRRIERKTRLIARHTRKNGL